jgi:GT2 family glycosyltransferase
MVIVIVSYETRDLTRRCTGNAIAFGGTPGHDTSVVVVDNGSRDGTAAMLREDFCGLVDVVESPRNAGFGAACNAGAGRRPDAAWYLFLNADAELARGALAALVAAGDADPAAAILGPTVLGADGRPQLSVRGNPTRLALLHQHTALRFLRVGAKAYARYRSPPSPEALMGAALLVRGDDFRALGGFDARYFLYFEDADLCRRAAERGRGVRFVPDATVKHASGASADHDRERALTWYLASLFQYVDRFDGRRAGVVYRFVFKPLFLVKLATDFVRDAAGAVAGRPGKTTELATFGRFLARGFWTFLAA